MTPTETKYVEKLKEFNKHLINILDKNFILFHRSSFESEISALESEMEKEKKYPERFYPDKDIEQSI